MDVKSEMQKENQVNLEELKVEVHRNREIKKIIKNEQKTELERNI